MTSSTNSFGFKFKGDLQMRIAGLHSIGKETRTCPSYQWNGLERSEEGRWVFQYTLHGQGAIRIGEQTYDLSKGHAFLVQIPSDHCYYLPDQSSSWEFIFITLFGNEVTRFFEQITTKHGHLFTFPLHAKPIKRIFHLLEEIATSGIEQAYKASQYAYSFLMDYLQYVEYEEQSQSPFPLTIYKAISFMQSKFAENLVLDDIVAVTGLSKYHFTRLFHHTVKETPMKYLAKLRIHQSIFLLKNSDLTIAEIATAVGFRSGNYFSKVFKNMINVPPSEYRKNQSYMPVDHFFID
ncbi:MULTISPECIES: AraC family transcriptional regulator [Virgibacillus]|uniref:L-rhamnose operon regulatory protein RhaS n=2 Tax=Virgibacillus TaxID=84406 RepID=A0A024QF83_9BACI|nr:MULTISPECIES: AraC family transcriptional regulator [Virgibacillus]EQB35226.1 hypothetical protein M948_19185 [Virgibacillus sp. CM-4]MYL42719.1 helix-turn-helix domain-containing protein [Virgibacillus massiliensis]GGJ68885.1 AraC family transcriptional regulator [Virgibacillus kapii]CDQ40611.1 L-rhamnose operon regulatory protein RhaS [Virgibacillus massiliensis]